MGIEQVESTINLEDLVYTEHNPVAFQIVFERDNGEIVADYISFIKGNIGSPHLTIGSILSGDFPESIIFFTSDIGESVKYETLISAISKELNLEPNKIQLNLSKPQNTNDLLLGLVEEA